MLREVFSSTLALCFAATSVCANTPCPYPKKAHEQCITGSAVIDIDVTFPGAFSAQARDVKPEVFRSTAACIATHADFFFPKETQAIGKHALPLTFDIDLDFVKHCAHR